MGEKNKNALREISVGFVISGLLLNILIFAEIFQIFRLLQVLLDERNSFAFRGLLPH